MTKYLATLFAALAIAVTAVAAGAPEGPISLPAKNGNVTFNHKTHAAVSCDKCHATAQGGKIADFGKEKAHALCMDCHKTSGQAKAPTKCAECHKKA